MDNSLTFALIDMGLFWAFWHKAKAAGEAIGVSGNRFVGMVRNISLKHTRTVVCCDSPVLFRRSIQGGEGYKRRPDKTVEEKDGIDRAVGQIKSLGLTLWEVEGYESDDLMAALAEEASGAGWFVRIYSDDKDLEACVIDGRVSVYKRARDKGEAKDWTSADVLARRGVLPARVPELLALMGDSADSIPGVTGIGEEAAKAIVAAYPHMYLAYDDVGPDGLPGQALPERTRKALKEGRAALDLSYALVKLDMTAKSMIDKALLVPPEIVGMGGQQTTDPIDETARPERSHVETNGAKSVEVLHETKNAEEPPGILDQVADKTEQRAKVEGWIGTSFADRLEPKDLSEAWRLAGILDQAMSPGKNNGPPSRTYAKIGNRSAIFAVILKGTEINLPAMLSLAHIKPVEGKLEVDAMLMMAIALRSGRVSSFRWLVRTNQEATIEIVVDGRAIPCTWNLDTARQAELLLPTTSSFSPWKKYTRIMLQWRAVSEVLRANVPEAVTGLYVVGEIGEMDEDDVRRGVDLEQKVLS